MNIWYDVTGLTHWNRLQLTGIQRTTVGILNGLVAEGVPVVASRTGGWAEIVRDGVTGCRWNACVDGGLEESPGHMGRQTIVFRQVI